MKHLLILTVFLIPVTAIFAGPADIGLLPQDKKAVVVEESEPNPFGKRARKSATEAVIVVESEETRIRGAISRLPLGGITRGYGVTKVLLGSHMISAGEVLPDMIPKQTERVKVLAVNENEIELGFVEEDGTIGERTMLFSIDLKPTVRYRLRGYSPPKSGEDSISFDGLLKDHETYTPRQ